MTTLSYPEAASFDPKRLRIDKVTDQIDASAGT